MINTDKTEENASMPKGIFRQETTEFGDMGDSFWDTRRRKSAGAVHFIGNQGKFSAIANHYPPDIMNIGAYGGRFSTENISSGIVSPTDVKERRIAGLFGSYCFPAENRIHRVQLLF